MYSGVWYILYCTDLNKNIWIIHLAEYAVLIRKEVKYIWYQKWPIGENLFLKALYVY